MRVSVPYARNLQNHREKPGLLSRASSLPDEKWECNNRAQNIKYNKNFRWIGEGGEVGSLTFLPRTLKICERQRQMGIEEKAKKRQRWAAEREATRWRAELRKPLKGLWMRFLGVGGGGAGALTLASSRSFVENLLKASPADQKVPSARSSCPDPSLELLLYHFFLHSSFQTCVGPSFFSPSAFIPGPPQFWPNYTLLIVTPTPPISYPTFPYLGNPWLVFTSFFPPGYLFFV